MPEDASLKEPAEDIRGSYERHGIPLLRPEAQLLLFASANLSEEETRTHAEALLEGAFDWDYFLEIAKRNRLVGFAYRCVSGEIAHRVPPEFLSALRTVHLETVHHTLELKRELLRLLDACAEADIQLLPYKGVAIATYLYENVAFRQSWDLDVLVRPEDFTRAAKVLESMGYESEVDFDAPGGPELPRKDCEVGFARPQSDTVIELHWDFLPPAAGRAASADFLWNSAQTSELEGRPVLAPSDEALLQMLLLHGGVKHAWATVRSVVDIGRLVQMRPDLDVDAVLAEAKRLKCERTALVGLNLARLLLGVELPEDVTRRIEETSGINATAALAFGRLFGEVPGLPSYREWIEYLDACGRLEEGHEAGAGGLVRYVRALLRPEFADRFLLPPLPRGCGFVYYLIRPIRLFGRHGLGLFKRM